MPTDGVEFGWGAKPIGEQFPEIPSGEAEHFQKDSTSIIRLHIRGLITDSVRDSALKKLAKRIEKAILQHREKA